MPEIFRYSDYRAYLRDWFEEKKKKNPAFSLRSLSKRGRPVPHSTFWMVMRGERNLTSVSLKQFISILQLEGRDALYFEALVMFNQAKGWDLKQRQLERIVEMRFALNPADLKKLKTKSELDLYSSWYMIPIHILLESSDFKAEASWIAERLGAEISEAEVRRAIDSLLLSGLVEYRNNSLTKRYSRVEVDISSAVARPSTVYFAEMSRRAADAYENLSLPAYAGTAGTFMASKEDIALIRERLDEVASEINALLDKRPGPKELYQLSATYFPLSRNQNKKPKKSR